MAAEGITVVCKTLKEGTFELPAVETSITVGELKGLMTEARENITDPKTLKLVFKGKILKDQDSLEKAGFTAKNNKVVVMKTKAKKKKAKPVEASTVPQAAASSTDASATSTSNNNNAPAAASASTNNDGSSNAAAASTEPTMATESSNAQPANNQDYTAEVAQLVALGVPQGQALNALRMTNGNVELAANLALSGGLEMAAMQGMGVPGNAAPPAAAAAAAPPQGMGGMPGMMGGMPSPAALQAIASNPELLNQIRQMPQFANNPQMQAILSNPQMLQALLARMAQGQGGMGGMGAPQAPAPVQIQLTAEENEQVAQVMQIGGVQRQRAVRAYIAGGKNVEHALNLIFSGALDD